VASTAREDAGTAAPARRLIRSGTFEIDLESGELRKAGALVKLRQQSFRLLSLLVSEPGRVLTREDLSQRVWADDTFVDFDQGLNSCIKEIRAALGDNAESPLYVETLPRRGYRWIGPATEIAPAPAEAPPAPPHPEASPRRTWLQALHWLVTIGALALAGWLAWRPQPPAPRWQQVTFQRGWIDTARFVPGGGIAYAAAWGDGPLALYEASTDSPDARRLALSGVRLQAVSARGELAVLRADGLLARTSLAGGPAKDMLERIVSADFGPDGSELTAVHMVAGEGARLEFPVGHVVGPFNASEVRVSRDGRHVAFIDHPVQDDDRGLVVVCDRAGGRRSLGPLWPGIDGLAWSPDGSEVWFTAAADGAYALRAVSLTGRVRTVLPAPGRVRLRDVSPDGRVLIERASSRVEASFVGAAGARDLSWFDGSVVADLSRDGRLALLAETGEAGGREHAAYLRPTDGGPPLRVGAGRATGLSPDGSWVATIPVANPDHVDLLPVGAGEPRRFRAPGIARFEWADFTPDGSRLLFVGQEPDRSMRVWVGGLDGAAPRPLTPERLVLGRNTVSPDGRWLVAGCPPLTSCLYPLDGGERVPLPTIGRSAPLFWSTDARALFVSAPDPAGIRVERLEIASGRRTPWRTLGPSDRVGFVRVGARAGTLDGAAVAFSVVRSLSELDLVTGVR
jgi:DNA-binding winged helix-turn-helix (wHTH) protein